LGEYSLFDGQFRREPERRQLVIRTTTFSILALISVLVMTGGSAIADDRDIGERLNDARLEGQLWASFALNRHLNPFDFSVTVKDGKATISGKVEESVQRDLAGEIALGINGIDQVDNQIEVVRDLDIHREPSTERSFGEQFRDATTTATVKSKLLWNRNTGGLAINVSTENGVVTLDGKTDSDASRQLAERLAKNTEGVVEVKNQLTVSADAPRSDRERGASEAISDTWITSKVKSTLLFSRDVPGTAVSVETRDGVVKLEGTLDSEATKAMVVELTRDIHGVKRVDDSALRVTPS
jgi:osmotically-inducible protein OsmY